MVPFSPKTPPTKKASPFRLRSTQASGKASHWLTKLTLTHFCVTNPLRFHFGGQALHYNRPARHLAPSLKTSTRCFLHAQFWSGRDLRTPC